MAFFTSLNSMGKKYFKEPSLKLGGTLKFSEVRINFSVSGMCSKYRWHLGAMMSQVAIGEQIIGDEQMAEDD